MTVGRGIVSAVGRTPIVAMTRLFPDVPIELFGKLEFLNPGGSVKDRPALHIIEEALEQGRIAPGSVVVESSSGNMAVGLAQACLYYGLRLICVLDSKALPQNLRVLRTYGAEIDVVDEPDAETGELLQARLNRVRQLCESNPGSFWPNQYANRGNPMSHYRTTMQEVVDILGEVDYVFVATSTCGTLRGCGELVRDLGLTTKLIAVDAYGSLIFSDEKRERHVPGIGAGLKPPHCDHDLIHRFLHVSDMDCVFGCRRLLEREAILAGGSSGGVVQAISRMAVDIPAGSRCVAILCDRGERYLETVYDDRWVSLHCGGLAPSIAPEEHTAPVGSGV